MAPIRCLTKAMPSMRQLNLRFVSTSSHLRQEAQLSDVPPPPQTTMPPNPASESPISGEKEAELSDVPPSNPASGSPMYGENWRNANTYSPAADAETIPIYLGLLHAAGAVRSLASTLDAKGLMDQFAKWTTEQRWADLKQLFELWIKSLDNSGKPNKPDVNLYSHYLRANLMNAASTVRLIDLVEQMTHYGIAPNTASYNLVLKSMQQTEESLAAEKLIERMLQQGQVTKDCLPDDESYDLIISLMLSLDRFDCAFKYIDLTLASGYMLSMNAFSGCVYSCIKNGNLDTLVSLVEKCKKMDQNKSLCPPWQTCNYMLDVAMQFR